MQFLDELRAVVRGEQHLETPPPELLRQARQHVYSRLRELDKDRLRQSHRTWSDESRLTYFVSSALRELDRGLAPSSEDRLRLLLATIDRAIPRGPVAMDPLEWFEILRISRVASTVVPYAAELGLVTSGGRRSAPGELFLSLVGREAIEWLLHLEVIRSTGPDDPWRIHSEVAELILAVTEADVDGWHPPDEVKWRLHEMGVLALPYKEDFGWKLLPTGRITLENVLADPPTPMHLLAQAALADDLASLTGGRTTAASSAAIDLSGMLAHEIRNALGPVRAAVDQLYRWIDPATTGLTALRERIDRGFGRLDKLASDTTRLTQQLGAPTPVPLPEAIEEALAATAHERNGRLRVERRLVDVEVLGRRDRLVLALVNLVRNAAQAAPPTGATLHVSLHLEAANVRVVLADDGPGIPESSTGSLFRPGFSLRGSSGMGLTLAKTIVEEEMGGAVRYQPTEGGGATFELILRRAGG